MFEALKLRFFVSKVKAEMVAQCHDQALTNMVCHSSSNLSDLNGLRTEAYYRKDKIAPFLAVCHILGESLDAEEFDLDSRVVCASLLADRLQKARQDTQRHMRHFQIFVDLEQKLEAWIEKQK